jgi:2-polyprenyl-6-hydroxyphenyl methylase/3-demethylubiquinone-9 3-methyltransferase
MQRSMGVEDGARFAFGKNWQSFIDQCLSDERVRLAKESLRALLGMENLEGRTFLDVGCGSGLYSLAAVVLGAEQVTSFDYDGNSVEASEQVRAAYGVPPERWSICQGSILDDRFLAALKPADVVYCWGVAHHTGDMWRALDNLAHKVNPGGLLQLAIYNKIDRPIGGSRFWLKIKRVYNSSSGVVRRAMEYAFVADFILRQLVTLRNPFAAIRNYPKNNRGRGMDFWHDVRDWMGGYPYEFATAGEVFEYLHTCHELQLERLKTVYSIGCNEFVFSAPRQGRLPEPETIVC